MEAIIKCDCEENVIEFDGTESDLFCQVGKILLQCKFPCKLTIDTALGFAEYDIGERGSYKKNGVDVPSMLVSEQCFDIEGLIPSNYQKAFLTCINLEGNNYKFYELRQEGDGVHARYGRIGCSKGEMFGEREVRIPYPTRFFWLKYYEKISKGYIDMTSTRTGPLIKEVKQSNKAINFLQDDDKTRLELYNLLYAFAHDLIRDTLIQEDVTVAQVRTAKAVLRKMSRRKTVEGFNNQLSRLLALSPRKARYLENVVAKSPNDFDRIIKRETDLIAAMEGVAQNSENAHGQRFGSNVVVLEATATERKIVESCLSERLQKMLGRIWTIIIPWQNDRFETHLKAHNITNTKLLWHGSPNPNWLSIVLNGLVITPTPEHGRMFGDGIYCSGFSSLGSSASEAAEKSFNYTSFHGSYWSHGHSSVAFMGLYEAAY